MRKLLGAVQRRDFSPLGLINANAVQDGRKFMAIFSRVDHTGICPENIDAIFLQPQRDILRELT